MIDRGIVAPATSFARLVHPLGVVIKNSDKHRAHALANISITNSESLTAASDALVAMGLPKVKCRITTDCTATGLNAASLSPTFQYMTLSEGLRIVRRNDVLGKGDITRYFFCFPLAVEARKWFCVKWENTIFEYHRLMFGHTACLYFCSAWSAEFHQWFAHLGIPTSFIMDDWLVSDTSLSKAKAQMDTVARTLESVGIEMAEDKYGFGQQLTFIGILIDTVSMSVRIDKDQAGAFLVQLRHYRQHLLAHSHLSEDSLRHLAGKLNWFSEVCQGGRIHIHSLWRCISQSSQRRIAPLTLQLLLKDLDWWEKKLTCWANSQSAAGDFRLFSGSEILANKHLVIILQSDASGTDGFGYFFSTLHSASFKWVSRSWPAGFTPQHSHHAELLALLSFLQSATEFHGLGSLLIWVSDCEAACWSINKGNCHDPTSFAVLADIYALIDEHLFQVLALWVPREDNQFADHLSHLSTLLSRSTVEGFGSL